MAAALHHAARGRAREAHDCLGTLLDRAELPFSGWTIPIEPLFAPLRESRDFDQITLRLADRAR